ncbi:hypothetical protein C1752_12222 [Acaryochloris thomasi RCC1774]|uniref:ParB-like N-terminal domain-containing protein n=1 Tax=Acaryochloris thomasi RCC1774 TaxID=1764569 RepID=A0A2W1J7J5_9CYAN|nr:ParB/RepB/Spo0J family partition protein [Acaryochloris thomasi]PZD70439.1 hypothetical protein C1752_12222 [Acaryochloris thomasi RCC1774]
MARPRRSSADMVDSATKAGTAIQKQDRAVEAQAQEEKAKPSSWPLEKILDRSSNTRDIQVEHVEELMESIAVLGLLEPLVTDNRGRLLAGAHRRAAIHLLKDIDTKAYRRHFPNELVPVRIMPFDAEQDPDLALQVEVSENEKRRDYTPSEVKSLAAQLKEAGYVDVKGRPPKSKKALRPALEIIIGKSIRTVRRYLNTETGKSVTDVRLSETELEITALRRLRSELVRWQRSSLEPGVQELTPMDKDVAKLIRRINRKLDSVEG